MAKLREISILIAGLIFAPLISAQADDLAFGWSLKVEPGVLKKQAARGLRERVISGVEAGEIRVDTELVLSDVLVQDRNGVPIAGLAASDFEITEDGTPRNIDVFAFGDSAIPRSIILVIDHSLSQWRHIDRSVGAAKVLVDSLRPADRMAIVSDDVTMISELTSDKQFLKQKLDSLRDKCTGGRFGRSQQYSALFAALNERVFRDGSRNIVIFQTDGDERVLLRGDGSGGPLNFGIKDIPAVGSSRVW